MAQFILAEDPRAIDVERALVWTYVASESNDAAALQYQHFATNYRETIRGVTAHICRSEGRRPVSNGADLTGSLRNPHMTTHGCVLTRCNPRRVKSGCLLVHKY